MGNQTSNSDSNDYINIDHPKFQKAQLLKDHDIIRTHIPIDHQFHFDQWISKLNNISNMDDQILLFPRSYRYVRRAICGSSGQLQIDFQKYNYLMENQLRNRRHIRKFFDETELWYLAYTLVNAAHNFKKINSKIGDIRPPNIFINQEGQIKIANLLSWPNEATNYIKTSEDQQKTYLAPQQMQNLRNGQGESYIDKYKAQSFSIGITLLEAALMRDMKPLYNPYTKNFDSSRLQQHIKDWWSLKFQKEDEQKNNKYLTQYSIALKVLIASLCECAIQNRTTSQEVLAWLKQYQQQINDLKNFNKSTVPLKGIQRYKMYLQPSYHPSPENRPPYNPQLNQVPYENYFHQYSTLSGNNPQNIYPSSLNNYSNLYSPPKYQAHKYNQQIYSNSITTNLHKKQGNYSPNKYIQQQSAYKNNFIFDNYQKSNQYSVEKPYESSSYNYNYASTNKQWDTPQPYKFAGIQNIKNQKN